MDIKASIKNEKAFTLIELVLTVFIISIIGGIIAGSYVAGTKVRNKQEDSLEIQQNLRVALYVLARELKLAAFDLTPNWDSSVIKNLNIITAPANDRSSITFQYEVDGPEDVNWDGISDDGARVSVTYALNPQTRILNRTVAMLTGAFAGTITQPMPIASNICSTTFSYYNDNGDGSGVRVWNADPAVAPQITVAVGVTLVVQNEDKIDIKLNAEKRQFRDPYTNTLYETPEDQIRRRMGSTVVSLRNQTFRLF